MAYNASVDYQALKNQIQKQIDAETNATKKAQLQSQYDAAEQSRLEKMASDLGTYGKYATGSELNQAAGIAAENQIGTDYETQKKNLNASYDTAKQNAQNDALSRGMARSSYVSDRLANIDTERAGALSDVDAARAKAIESAKASILSDYQTNAATAAENTQSDARSQISTILNAGGTPSNTLWNSAGYDPSTVAALKAAAQQAAVSSGYSGTSGGTTSTTGTSKTAITSGGDYDGLYSAAKAYAYNGGNINNFIASNYKKYGFTSSTGLSDYYDTWNSSQGMSDSYRSLETKVSRIMDAGNLSDAAKLTNAVNTIEAAYNAGTISETQARKLLSSYGLS